jgi:hypothetical protein
MFITSGRNSNKTAFLQSLLFLELVVQHIALGGFKSPGAVYLGVHVRSWRSSPANPHGSLDYPVLIGRNIHLPKLS